MPRPHRQRPWASLLPALAEGSAGREHERHIPDSIVDQVKAAGIGALRVPADHGGPDVSLVDLFDAVMELSAVDANVAHILRQHHAFIETQRVRPPSAQRSRWLRQAAAGTLFGNASSEIGSDVGSGALASTLRPDGTGYRLDAVKHYTTGNRYADVITVRTRLPHGEIVLAVVPADRDGVHIDDDWNGFGQRSSATGTTRLIDVRVETDEIGPPILTTPASLTGVGTFFQLYLTAAEAGIMAAATRDGARLLKQRTRTFDHGSAPRAADDPILLQTVGTVSSYAFAAQATVRSAARALETALESVRDGTPEPGLAQEAGVLAAQAKVVVDELGPRATTMLFDLGAASAVSRDANLDRHWRNLRTLASHNPAAYKARAVGDLLTNLTPLPTNGYF